MGLKSGSLLGEGRYRIVRELGQGGFGITYLAIQKGLDREVAIKEFFMKELCERDVTTSRVSIGTEGGRDTVERFREKFLKEARNIGKLNHPNIVRIMDIFEENGTAYYVMEYAENGSLADKVRKEGYLSEAVATRYIIQVADAIDYIHQHKMNHLDVKPANIILSEKDMPILIDFGLSKQYDNVTGGQTSTTPVGISEGYAPMEQYMQGGVGVFSPETDIYSLGATFYKLLTGNTPPNASIVTNEGLPLDDLKAKGISDKAIAVIVKAMEGRKKDRMKSAKEFIDGLGIEDIDSSPAAIKQAEEGNATDAAHEEDNANSLASENTRLIDKDTESTKIIANELKPQPATSKLEEINEPKPSSNVKVSVVSDSPGKPKVLKKTVPFIFSGILLIMAIIGMTVLRNIANSPMINGQKHRGNDLLVREYSSSEIQESFILSNVDINNLVYSTLPEWCHVFFNEDCSQFTISCDKNPGEERSTYLFLLNSKHRYAQMFIVQEGGNVSEIAKSGPEVNEVQTTKQTSVTNSDSKQSSPATQQDKAVASSFAPSNNQSSATSVSGSTSKKSSSEEKSKQEIGSSTRTVHSRSFTMSVGEEVRVELTEGIVSRWEISDKNQNLCRSDGGILKGISAGQCKIWGYIDGTPYFFDIYIDKNKTQATKSSARIDKPELTLNVGESSVVSIIGNIGEVTWESSNPSIATVNKDGLVKGISVGTADVWATFDNYVVRRCSVTVIKSSTTHGNSSSSIAISGKIVDEKGKPFSGASVWVKGSTTNGTVSDIDGGFTLTVKENDIIEVIAKKYKSLSFSPSEINGAEIKMVRK